MKKAFSRFPLALPALVLAAALAGCQPAAQSAGSGSAPAADPGWMQRVEPEPGGVDITGLNAENYPRVDGSTANLPLMALVQSRICGIPPEEAETLVTASQTSEAWLQLARGEADLLMVYEAPRETQAELTELGVALEVTPIGLDALVFLTNTDNPVDGLTQAQLRDIYTARATRWEQLGGEGGEIAAFQRNPTSGSHTLFLSLLMRGEAPADPPTDRISMGMGGLIDVLSSFDGSAAAIGYSVYYYASEMYHNPQLKFLAVDGVPPTAETLADGSYPLTNPFYAVIRADEPQDSPARLLRNWLAGKEGALAVAEAGYVAYSR